jgi:hypothetical protein
MTRAHRSVGANAEDHAAAWTAPAPRPVRGARRPPSAIPVAATETGDLGDLTLDELVIAADVRRVAPSSLLGERAQAHARETLELVAGLPDPVAALVGSMARLDPAATAMLAGMIDRLAAADRRRRPPSR